MNYSHPVRAAALALVATSIAACTKAEPQAEAPLPSVSEDAPSPGQPITLHARIRYLSSWETPDVGNRRFELQMNLLQPAFRQGSGPGAQYSIDPVKPAQVQGSLQGSGKTQIVDDDTSLTETYRKSADWPKLSTPTGGLFSVQAPEPSNIGEGLRVRLKLIAPVMGESSARASSSDGSADIEPQIAVPLECKLHHPEIEGLADGCGIELDIDAVPTGPQDDAGQVLFPAVRDALAQPNGAWTMALLGNHYGATTEYRTNGHFIVKLQGIYSVQQDGAASQMQVELVIWSTDPREVWSP